MSTNHLNFEEIVEYLKKYGFVFQHGTIYGGLMNTYDYGPLGAHLKRAIKQEWYQFFVKEIANIHEMDSGILTHEKILIASEHDRNFQEMKGILINKFEEYQINAEKIVRTGKIYNEDLLIPFGTLFKLFLFSKTSSQIQKVYLRPETAQNIFINFENVIRAMKLKLPFGLAQIGKAFRKEFVSKNFIMRSWEFEQMEIEYFFDGRNSKETEKVFQFWNEQIRTFLTEKLFLQSSNIRATNVTQDLPHYSKKTIDWEYKFPNEWREIVGLSARGNFDLLNHSQKSGSNLVVKGSDTKSFHPDVIEPSFGVERIMMAMIHQHLFWEVVDQKKRLVLKLKPQFCYYQIAVLPLTNKLTNDAKSLYKKLVLSKIGNIAFDDRRSIGFRYLYHDAVGTKFSITYDFDVKKTNTITVRNRDTTKQVKIQLDKLIDFLKNEL